MGNTSYSTTERKISDKFVTWLGGVKFTSDEEYLTTLKEIIGECETAIAALKKDA